MNSIVAMPIAGSAVPPAPFNFEIEANDLDSLWTKRKSLVSEIRRMLREAEAQNGDYVSYEKSAVPLLRSIMGMKAGVTRLPDSPNKLGLQALLALEYLTEGDDETPNDCSSETAILVAIIETLSSMTTGIIAQEIAELLKDRDRPIRDLACLCP